MLKPGDRAMWVVGKGSVIKGTVVEYPTHWSQITRDAYVFIQWDGGGLDAARRDYLTLIPRKIKRSLPAWW